MSWRTVVVTGNAKLDYKMDYLVVRKAEATTRIFIGEIGLLIIESTAVSLTTMLLSELIKHKIKVVFCDEKHNPQSELISYYGSHDTSAKIRTQIQWTREVKENVWTEIVAEKVKQQSEHLKKCELKVPADMLKQYIEEMELGDKTNREGHAAKVYFNALFGIDFSKSKDCAINAALNYGYGILLSCFNREVIANGYITQLGLFHNNMFNQFNLSSDLMEPFRILVDRIVVKNKPEKFDSEEKMNFIYMLEDEVMIDGKHQYISNAIKIYCKSIFDALNENDVSLIKFYEVI